MEYQAEKKKLFESLVNNRVPEKEFFAQAKKEGIAAPDELLKRWKKRFYAVPKIEYKDEIKTLNKFALGADPEFIFAHPNSLADAGRGTGMEPRYIHSEQLGLNTIEAFGADMTGRQAELRAYPDRSALRVVASILDTLRWLAFRYPNTLQYDWLADAFIANDGVGGHVHFGRKRPNRDESIKSLDALTALIATSGCVDGQGHEYRLKVTKYGRPGDIRVQPHGYEYRSMPTWMATPRSAFLVLTLSKLCVFHNLRVPMKQLAKELNTNVQQVMDLLRLFAGQDDDARLALYSLEKFGMPMAPKWTDFKRSWGITCDGPSLMAKRDADRTGKIRYYVPAVIKPTEKSVREVWEHIHAHVALKWYQPEPTWSPLMLPKSVYRLTIPAHRPGLPEVAQNILSKEFQINLQPGAEGSDHVKIYIPPSFTIDAKRINDAVRERQCKFTKVLIASNGESSGNTNITIDCPGNIQHNYVVDKDVVTDMRWLLCKSGFLPAAKYTEIDSLDMEVFAKKKDQPVIGKVVYQIAGSVAVEPHRMGPGER